MTVLWHIRTLSLVHPFIVSRVRHWIWDLLFYCPHMWTVYPSFPWYIRMISTVYVASHSTPTVILCKKHRTLKCPIHWDGLQLSDWVLSCLIVYIKKVCHIKKVCAVKKLPSIDDPPIAPVIICSWYHVKNKLWARYFLEYIHLILNELIHRNTYIIPYKDTYNHTHVQKWNPEQLNVWGTLKIDPLRAYFLICWQHVNM